MAAQTQASATLSALAVMGSKEKRWQDLRSVFQVARGRGQQPEDGGASAGKRDAQHASGGGVGLRRRRTYGAAHQLNWFIS